MNVYFLVEGRRTEAKLYPAWLSHLVPELRRVNAPDEATDSNYFLISAEGYPSILNDHIPNSIADIKTTGNFEYFAVCLDADEVSVQERINEVHTFLSQAGLELDGTQLILIIQNRCVETWFLGNRRIYPRQPQDLTLLEFTRYYDVSSDDLELMGIYGGFNTHARFHGAYLKAIFRERNISYSKRRPGHVLDSSYLDQLLARVKDESTHLPTFQHFLDFCRVLKTRLQIH